MASTRARPGVAACADDAERLRCGADQGEGEGEGEAQGEGVGWVPGGFLRHVASLSEVCRAALASYF